MKTTILTASVCSVLFAASQLAAHCQIPCGIYDDATQLRVMAQHVATIRKSVTVLAELEKAEKPNYNQIVRWVNNKDEHANKFSESVTYYFMAQRIKSVPAEQKEAFKAYQEKLTLLHQMLVTAMKCKQEASLEHVDRLEKLLHQFEHAYMGEHSGHKH